VINNSILTGQINVSLRMGHASVEGLLVRAIRDTVSGSALTVESAVRVVLAETDDVLFCH